MGVFKDYGETKMVVLEWQELFEAAKWDNIIMTIDLLDNCVWRSDDRKVREMVHVISDGLWGNKEAETMGFKRWIIYKRKETIDMIEYYKVNDNEYNRISEKEENGLGLCVKTEPKS